MADKAFDWRNANRRGLLIAAFLLLGGAAAIAFPGPATIPKLVGHYGSRAGSTSMRLDAGEARWAGGICMALGVLVAAGSAYVPRAFRRTPRRRGGTSRTG